MTWCINEEETRDLELLIRQKRTAYLVYYLGWDLRRTDMLGYPSGLPVNNPGSPDPVEKGGLSVVHMTENRYNGLPYVHGDAPVRGRAMCIVLYID